MTQNLKNKCSSDYAVGAVLTYIDLADWTDTTLVIRDDFNLCWYKPDKCYIKAGKIRYSGKNFYTY